MMHKHHKFTFIALLKPFQNASYINKYRRRPGMPLAKSNCNINIWYFTNEEVGVDIIMDTDQQVNMKLYNQSIDKIFFITIVYAKCDVEHRLTLWEDIYKIANNMDNPWIFRGDFNVVLNEEERIGELPVMAGDNEHFACLIDSYELTKVRYRGSPFTW